MPRPLTLKYVPVTGLALWQGNPKLHSLEDIKESIRRHGFRDPPAFDATLGAIVDGNGRGEALQEMEAAGEELPRGLAADKKGKWIAPVVFGLDAESRAAAEAYGLDANSTTLGPAFDSADVARLYDSEQVAALVAGWGDNGNGLDGLVLDFIPEPEEKLPPDDFPIVDEDLPTDHECPRCGYVWSGSSASRDHEEGEAEAGRIVRQEVADFLASATIDADLSVELQAAVAAEIERLADVFRP